MWGMMALMDTKVKKIRNGGVRMQKIPRAVFTKEFKEEAVKMVIDGGLSQPEACLDFRCALRHWPAG